MGIEFSIPEVLRLTELGKFTLCSFEFTIDSSLADTTRPGAKAATATLAVAETDKLITERFNWGGTSISNKVYYELHYERGIYCGAGIRQSNQENICTHLFVADFIDVVLWNISSPAEDVFIDFTVWYYTFPQVHEEEIRDMFFKRDRLLQQIVDQLIALRPAPPPPFIGGR